METKQNTNNLNLNFKMTKATEEDFEFCYTIFKENMKDLIEKNWGWKEDIFKHNFRIPEIRIIEDKSTNKQIGYFQIQYKKDLTYIKEIQIQTEFQNKGIGTQILKIIEKEANEKKLSKLQLQVFKDNKAKEMYEKFGFKQTKDLDKSIIMEYF